MQQFCNAIEFGPRLLKAAQDAKSICLTTHIDPDGDGLCTCLALKRIFKHLGFESDIIVDEYKLDRFNFLNASNEVIVDSEFLQYDLVIVIDLHDNGRLSTRLHLISSANNVFVMDHHQIEHDMMACNCCWVDASAVCTGWMLNEIFETTIRTMSPEDRIYIGSCLYTSLLNDTNNFTNANTDQHAYELSAAICSYGTKPYLVHRAFLMSRSPAEMKFIGLTLSTIELYENDTILFIHSTISMLRENNLDDDATSNITRWVQDLKGVNTVVYFREEGVGSYRLSLRSKTLNIHSIAIKYGGGGHIQASGCLCKGNLAELKKQILTDIAHAEKLTF
jgi:phosphoesterase RecJ-like protein